MILVEFKKSFNGLIEIKCKSISSDPMDENIFLLQLKGKRIIEINSNLIKHISPCK